MEVDLHGGEGLPSHGIVGSQTPSGGRPPPPVSKMTDTCKNITFPMAHIRVIIN